MENAADKTSRSEAPGDQADLAQLVREAYQNLCRQRQRHRCGAVSPGDASSPDDLNAHPANTLNDLSGAEWLYFTKSVLETAYPSIMCHSLRKQQGGNKPPQLMQHLIEFFTKRNGMVLDPFAGAGGTLLGAHLAGRLSMGIELNPESVALYHRVCAEERIDPHPMLTGDCRDVMACLPADAFDFIATDPPYSIRLKQTMSGDKCNAAYNRQNRKSGYVPYSTDPRDFSNLGTFEDFYQAMATAGKGMWRVLRPGRYLALILRDAYQEGRYIPVGYRVAQEFERQGFILKGVKVWHAAGARIRPYGYPYAYVPNIIHQNIWIFQKQK